MNEIQTRIHTTPQPIRYSIAIAFTLLCTVMLLQSSTQPLIGPAAPEGDPDLAREIMLTAGHIIVFSGLPLLWTWTLASHFTLARALSISAGLALVYGLATEILQGAVPSRNASLYDLVVNTTTVLITAWLIWRAQALNRTKAVRSGRANDL